MFEYELREQFGLVSSDTRLVEMVKRIHFWTRVTI